MPDDLRAHIEGDLVFNGINAITGEYGQPPLSSEKLARLIRGVPLPRDYRDLVERQKRLADLVQVEDRLQRVTDAQSDLQAKLDEVRLSELRFKAQNPTPWPTIPGAGDPADVANVGWGAIFPAEMHPNVQEEIKEALQPLFDLRRAQAGDLFHIYEGGSAYRSGERKGQFLERLGVGPGLADPREMPFYLLLVGTPEEIPYSFQYQLDVMRAVGRLDFGSDIEAYQNYAWSIVAAESGDIVLQRQAAFFAPTNRGDKATQLSAQVLVQPLYENLSVAAPEFDIALDHDWDVVPPFMGEGQATHDQLQRLLGGDSAQTPALLFTASHGIEFPANHPAQLRQQGALLCQDWPGPGADVLRNHYFAAEDVDTSADLTGMIAFFFACYGAGTPQLDQFASQAFKVREKIAPRSFTAALPQQLLKQGALAVVGHVERAWGYSFISPQGRGENQAFITAMRTLMNGAPIGIATDCSFDMRYAELSSDLSADLEELKWNPSHLSDYELAYRWTANNDARSYVVIGDPAARLPIAEPAPAPDVQPDLGVIAVPEPEPAVQPVEDDSVPWAEDAPAPPLLGFEGPPGVPPVPEVEPAESILEAEVWQEVSVTPVVKAAAPEPEPVALPVEDELVDTTMAGISVEDDSVSRVEDALTSPLLSFEGSPGVPPVPEVEPAESILEAEVWQEVSVTPAVKAAAPVPEPVFQPVPVLPAALSDHAAIGYGLEDQFEKLKASLKSFTDQLATSLGDAAEDIVTLDVRTYSASDIAAVAEALDSRQAIRATLRALTRVAFDGDLQVYVPEKIDRGVDPELWSIHKAMVEEAQVSRANFLATMAELAARLLDSLRIGP